MDIIMKQADCPCEELSATADEANGFKLLQKQNANLIIDFYNEPNEFTRSAGSMILVIAN